MSGDHNIEAQAAPKPSTLNADHNKLLDESSFSQYVQTGGKPADNSLSGIDSTAGGRTLHALGKGLVSYTGQGIWNAGVDAIDHPWQTLEKAGIGLAFGIGLRVLLPEAGAAKAFAGTVFGAAFLKDAVTPIAHTIVDASNARNEQDIDKAARGLGDGLGHFAVDSTIAMVPGMLGEHATGALLKGTTRGKLWEDAKMNFFNSEDTAVGRTFLKAASWADRTSESVADSSDAFNARITGQAQPRTTPLGIDEKLARISKVKIHNAEEAGATGPIESPPNHARFDLSEAMASERRYLNIHEHADQLLGDRSAHAEGAYEMGTTGGVVDTSQFDPIGGRRRINAEDGEATPTGTDGFKSPQQKDGTGTGGEGDKQPAGTNDAADGQGKTTPPSGKDTTQTSGEEKTGTGNDGTKAGKQTPKDDTTAGDTPDKPVLTVKQEADREADALRKMAVALRTFVGKVTKEDIAVAQVREDFQGPLTSAMRSGEAPLDPDHFTNNEMLIALARQLRNPQDVRQAGMLLDHYRTANQQLELSKSSDPGALAAITDMNMYTRSIHAFIIGRLRELGIPLDVLRSTNSPLFTIRDSGGAGHYTIPAIEGVTDAPVITYAREYQGLEGTIVSGVDTHESFHNYAYRDLLRFPAELRDKILTDNIVKEALKSKGIDVEQQIEVPGAPDGKMKLVDFLVLMLKAQANENTADMMATSFDPNTGRALAVLLGSLRKPSPTDITGPGLLENRSVLGKEMVDEEMGNTIGIEAHAIDRFRIKMAAQVMREGANGNTKLLAEAARLDTMADALSRPGTQYVWASADEPGKFVAVPQATVDALIPFLVKAQLDTPLEALNGHTWRELMPDLGQVYGRVDALSDQMAAAVLKGKTTMPTFDKTQYRIEDVFSAGLSGWLKAVELNAESGGKLTPDELMMRINRLSENLRKPYRNDKPELTLSGGNTPRVSDVAIKPLSFAARTTSWMARRQEGARNFMDRWAVPIGAGAASEYISPVLDSLLRDREQQDQIRRQMTDR